jgi:gliding motility-associated-like protein
MYVFTITDANNCTLIDTITLIGPENNLIVEITSTNESCQGLADGTAEVMTVSNATPPYSYLWTNGNTNPLAKDLVDDIYQVTVTDANGCIGTSTAIVGTDDNDCLEIHNAMSPNGDGENDTWIISGIQGKTDANVKVFNRWGSLIYESNNYQNDWNGTYKGKDLPAGIYYYIITVDGVSFEGSLTVIR